MFARVTTEAMWSALADPHRRALLDALRSRDCTVGELVDGVGLSQPSTSKHLRVLREAGLVRVRVDAQRRIYAVDPDGLVTLERWLAPYRQLWNDRLDALGRHLDATNPDATNPDATNPDATNPRTTQEQP